MTQFAVYRNQNARTRAEYPLLLDVQSELFKDLHTRVVVPLTKAPALTGFPMAFLTPALKLNGETYLMMTPQLAGLAQAQLGPQAGELNDQQQVILSALEFLAHGFF